MSTNERLTVLAILVAIAVGFSAISASSWAGIVAILFWIAAAVMAVYTVRLHRRKDVLPSSASAVVSHQDELEAQEIEKNSTETRNDGRVFVNVKAKDLAKIYKDNTKYHADKIITAFTGKWILISGVVSNVERRSNSMHVSLESSDPYTFLEFGLQWEQRLNHLRKGDRIRAEGRIGEGHDAAWSFEDCRPV